MHFHINFTKLKYFIYFTLNHYPVLFTTVLLLIIATDTTQAYTNNIFQLTLRAVFNRNGS